MQSSNPSLAPYVRVFSLIVSLILLLGGSLFIAPELVGGRWPWALAPFHARFLGAVYLAELAGVFMLFLHNRWAPGRLSIPLAVIFTAIVSVVSLMYFNRFDPQRRATWLWLILYIGSALLTLFFWWQNRHLPAADAKPLSSGWRNFLLGEGLIVGLYGLGLLLIPSVFAGFWPWPLDDFHARIYSAVFIAGAAGLLMLSRKAAPLELQTIGWTQAILGFCAVAGLIIVDSSLHRVNWSTPGTWLWVISFALLMLAGGALLFKSRQV